MNTEYQDLQSQEKTKYLRKSVKICVLIDHVEATGAKADF